MTKLSHLLLKFVIKKRKILKIKS